jgi:TIR domain
MTVFTGNVPGRIFMSYRREETAYPAAWLFDRLAGQFGRDLIFKDVDSIEPGDDFVEVITNAVGSCDVLLALIGARWLTIADQDGRSRLDDPDDFVRLEIEAALARKVRVIPILVDGARMPRAEDLPVSLAKLSRRHALELSPIRFEADTQRLLRFLEQVIAREQADRAAANALTQELERLHGQGREPTATRDRDAAVAINDELAAVDPALADSGSLASATGDQISRRGDAERASTRMAPEDNVASVSADQDAGAIREVLAAMIDRRRWNVQAMYDGLTDLGYIPGVPAPRPDGTRQLYLGWSDPARADKGRTRFTLYLESRTVSFGRVTDRRKVADLPGADTSPRAYVAFRISSPDDVGRALAAARAVKR